MMKQIDAVVGRLLAPLDGYKTKLGSWTLAALAANHAIPFLPDGIAGGLQLLAMALVSYGLRDAQDKLAAP